MKDPNAKKLYAAENRLWKGARFTSRAEIQNFADIVTSSAEWVKIKRNHVHVPARVKIFSAGDLEESWISDPDEIWLAERHWHQQAVLHELAHWGFSEMDHDNGFILGYLRLIAGFMGQSVREYYAHAFKQARLQMGTSRR